MTFRGDSVYIIYSNDMMKFTSKDAFLDCAIAQFKSQFVEEKELVQGCDSYKLKEDNFKAYIKNEDIISAFTFILLNQLFRILLD